MTLNNKSLQNNDKAKQKPSILKSILFAVIAIGLAFIVYYVLPSGENGLNDTARLLGAVFVAALVLWATEIIPIAVTSLLVLAIAPMIGVFGSLSEATVGFTSPVVYFVIASFIISIGVLKSGLARRLALFMINKSGTDSKRILLVFMVASAILSAFMSNVPSCAVLMSLAIPILKQVGAEKGKSKFAKSVMIGIPFAAFAGGVATPAGSSPNVLALELLNELTGINVTFVDWMAIGVPIAIIMTLVMWWVLTKVFPPEIKSIGSIDTFVEERKSLGRWNVYEKKMFVILCLLFTLWVASSWVSILNISVVAILGACVMFLPGIKLLSWKDAQSGVGWDSILIIGSVTSLGLASTQNGLSSWVVTNLLGGIGGMPIFWGLLIIAMFIVVIHLPMPINPTIVSAIVPAIVILAASSGVNPAIYALGVAFAVSAAFLLPLDAVPLVTYSKGYYKMFDMFIPGIIVSIVWVVVQTISLYLITPLLGLA